MDFIIYYNLIVLSSIFILGYAYIFAKLFKLNQNCIGINIIIGSFFLGTISLFLNFFFPLNKIINNIILIIGFISFIYNFKKFTEIKFFFIITIICFITLLLDTTNRPDAGAYHLPYISFLNNHEIIVGLANLNTKFGHISFYQYISSIFYNSIFKDRLLFAPIGLIYSATLIFFFKQANSVNNSPQIKILSLFFGILTVIDMNRFSGFGNDETTHMIFFIFLINLFLLFESKSNKKNEFFCIILILALFLFLNKTIYSLIIFLLIFIFFKIKKYIIILSKINLFLLFVFFLWCIKNLLITGCLIYPINLTCFDSIFWLNNHAVIEKTVIEAWSKGFPDLKETVKMETYVQNFNWLSTWFKGHFKIIFFKIILFSSFLLFSSVFIGHNGIKLKKSDIEMSLLIFSIFFLCTWFLQIPVYRMGAGFIIFFLSILSLNILKSFNEKNFSFLLKIITFVLIIIISLKNSKRIIEKFNDDYQEYPYINIYSEKNNLKKKYLKKNFLDNENFFYYVEDGSCYYGPSPCASGYDKSLNHNIFFNYQVISKKNGGHGKN